MARIWPVYEGKNPTYGEPWAELPLSGAIISFELRQEDFLTELDEIPRFGDTRRDLTFAGYKHIVVEIDLAEARKAKWKPGFYRSRIKPDEVFRRLIEKTFVEQLDAENVVRIDYEPTTDSQGDAALKIIAVITPGAPERMKGGAVLDALISLRSRLHELGDERSPIIEYATEAELAEYGGS